MISHLLIGAALLAAAPDASPDDLKSYEAARDRVGPGSDGQVKLALWCEAHGLGAARLKHLARAVLVDPGNATARGLLGLVDYRGKWQRPEAVGAAVRADEALSAALAEYNARRDRTPDTQEAQWKLGVWCEEHGLKAEATAHFTAVTRLPGPLRPAAGPVTLLGTSQAPHDHREAAYKRLGYHKHHGRWMTDEQVAAAKAEREAQEKADRHWHARLDALRKKQANPQGRDEAVRDLAAVTDPRAVPAVWRALAVGKAADHALAVQLLGQIDAPAASRGLVALSLFSPSDDARRAAAETLRGRDPREVIGLLIDAVHAPLKVAEARAVAGPGKSGQLVIEGEQFNLKRQYSPPKVPTRPGRSGQMALSNEAGMAMLQGLDGYAVGEPVARPESSFIDPRFYDNLREALLSAFAAQQQMADDLAAVEQTNAFTRRVNLRALPLLAELTGQDLGEDREAWKAWWTDQLGYAYRRPPPRPTLTQQVPLAYAPRFQPYSRGRSSCFGAGTPVPTLNGPRPIEDLKAGDEVLTQDTRTGVLSYKPILAVAHNKPAPTLRITLEGGEAVVATGIHRFWKAGEGWSMARDLKPGDRLRTLEGPGRVVSIVADEVQPVFNLEVGPGRGFLVGRAGALVHDNTLVEPVSDPFDAAPDLASVARTAE